MIPWLLACTPDPMATRPPPGSSPLTSPTHPPTSSTAPVGGVIVPGHVALPFTTVGTPVEAAELVVREAGGGVGERVRIDDRAVDFDVSGEGGPLGAGEARVLEVTYTGDVGAPRIATGTVTVTVGDTTVEVSLAAVVGDPDLPRPAWDTDDLGTSSTAPYPSAPFPDGASAWDDASVLVFVPSVFDDPGRVDVVTHLHGFGATLGTTVPAERLVEQHAFSGRDAIFVVPQGPENASSGDFGKLEADGGHARLVRDVVSVLYRDGLVERPALGAQVLTSHSGGYAATASLLDHGGLPIDGSTSTTRCTATSTRSGRSRRTAGCCSRTTRRRAGRTRTTCRCALSSRPPGWTCPTTSGWTASSPLRSRSGTPTAPTAW